MKYGIVIPNIGPAADLFWLMDLASKAEAKGWDGIYPGNVNPDETPGPLTPADIIEDRVSFLSALVSYSPLGEYPTMGSLSSRIQMIKNF